MLLATTRSALVRQAPWLRIQRTRVRLHQFHSSPPPHSPAPATAVSNSAILGSLTSELDRIAPRFDIKAHQVQIIGTPGDFYAALKDRILNAKRRIFLSTLYIGKMEHELIEALRTALRTQPNLKVSILSDALRGTRESPNPSSASLLVPLISEFGEDRVEIRMYHTPNLNGWKKIFIPKRLNEGWGLQHMKLYGIDDEVIMSGANLSDDYFTNRQDRYHIFACEILTNYYASIHGVIAGISYKVLPDPESQAGYTLEWPSSNRAPVPTEDPTEFRRVATSRLTPLIQPRKCGETMKNSDFQGTTVYALAQFTPLLHPEDTSTELPGLATVLRMLEFHNSEWVFTAGYFNIHPTLKRILLGSKARGTVITAAPEANGFYKSPGISGNLPPAYVLLSRRFLQDVHSSNREGEIELREWRRGTIGERDGWTYHAKGVWVNMPGDSKPSITLIGSSNYTRRSYSLDLEMNALVITQEDKLQSALSKEVGWLQQFSKKLELEDFKRADRQVGWKVRFLLWLFGSQL